MQPQALIELDEATKRFGDRVALDRFSLAIAPGSVVGILGPNGAGKTTVINLVAGLSRPSSGAVRWRGEAVVSPFPPTCGAGSASSRTGLPAAGLISSRIDPQHLTRAEIAALATYLETLK